MDYSDYVPPSDSDEENFGPGPGTGIPQRVYDFGEESTSNNLNYVTLLPTSSSVGSSPRPPSTPPGSTPASSSVSSPQGDSSFTTPVSSPQPYSSSGSSPTNSELPPSPHNYLYSDDSDDNHDDEAFLDNDDNEDDFGIPLHPPPSFPMVNYSRDVEHELDYEMGYEWREKDTGPLLQPFSGLRSCLIDPAQRKPEDFFTNLFDARIFTLMAECTNIYASQRLEQLNDNEKRHSRVRKWKDIGDGDVKFFLAHLVAMGLVRQCSIARYWEQGEIVRTPFFGTYMSRNSFQNILSNFQIVDNNDQVPRNHPNHDPLFKVRPMIDMMERTFRNCYRSGRDISIDEACCPFKGRLSFKCYNPSKPAKWHIKLFEISDAKTGYCLGFEVYAGKGKTRCANTAKTLDPGCTETTKVVMGLMGKCDLLDKGHNVYMDNYYTSPELFEELHYRNTYACGTCRSNRKNMSKAVILAKLKKGEAVFRCAGPLLCFKWNEKRDVRMLSTIHEACMVETGKNDALGNKIVKPESVYHYCKKMGGVDLNDQLLTYYSFLRKSVKWSRKLIIHMFNMVVLNAYILNKYYGTEKLSHDEYRDRIIKFLIAEGLKSYTIPLPPVMSRRIVSRHKTEHQEKRLSERHFPTNIPAAEGRKRKKPSRPCFVCNRLPGVETPLALKRTSFWCSDCGKPLCITPCFEFYHTLVDYKRAAMDKRLSGLVQVEK